MAAPFELAADMIPELLFGSLVRDVVKISTAANLGEW